MHEICQSLLSGKIKKNINLSFAEFAHGVEKAKTTLKVVQNTDKQGITFTLSIGADKSEQTMQTKIK